MTEKPLIWAPFFSHKKINFILFFKGDYLILVYYQKHALEFI